MNRLPSAMLLATLAACAAPSSPSPALPAHQAEAAVPFTVVNASDRNINGTEFSSCKPVPFFPQGALLAPGARWAANSKDASCLSDPNQTTRIQVGFRLSIASTDCAFTVSNATGVPVYTLVYEGVVASCSLSGSTLTYVLKGNARRSKRFPA
jgi:hypothetical protein